MTLFVFVTHTVQNLEWTHSDDISKNQVILQRNCAYKGMKNNPNIPTIFLSVWKLFSDLELVILPEIFTASELEGYIFPS